MVGSRRESVEDIPAELPGFPADMKLLIAACLFISSSCSRLCFRRRKKNAAPAIPAIAMTPTTTPAAMAALLDPPDEPPDDEVGVEAAVMVCVSPNERVRLRSAWDNFDRVAYLQL